MKKLAFFISLFVLLSNSNSFSQYYFNQYISFDGIDDYFSTPANSELNLDSMFTIECMIYCRDTTGFNKTILSTVNSANSDGYALMVQGSTANPGNAGKLLLNLNGINYSFIQTAATRIALNNWTHISVTFQNSFPNNDTIRFYINGTLIQNFYTNVPPLSNTTDPLRVGSQYLPGSNTNAFRGYIDDLRIYKATRSAAFIANDRTVPVTLNGITNITRLAGTRFANLNNAWPFDGNGNDGVGINNVLTANNGVSFVNNSFNPNQYRQQSNFYMRFGGTWLTGEDFTNSVYDADTAITLESWVYIDAYRATPQTIISKGTTSYSYNLFISSSTSNSPAFMLNSGTRYLQSNTQIPIKTWTHIAATYRASTGLMQIFINGILDATFSASPGNINVNNDSVYVGRNLFGEYHYGALDEIRISRYVKSQQEIQQYLYTSIDNQNLPSSLQACFGFEGSTRDNINNTLVLYPRSSVYFERLNNTSGAGGMHEAPLIRLSANDPGFTPSIYNYNGRYLSIPNGGTVRDSILVTNVPNIIYQVMVLIGHTNIGDLTVSLRNTSGTSVNLSTAIGGTNNDMMTFFSDINTDSLINSSLVPFSQKIRPQNSLSPLYQVNANGYVRLSITDNAATIDSGRVYMWGIRMLNAVSVQNQNTEAFKFHLAQNFPNPFNPTTKIFYTISKNTFVSLSVYDILGKEIETLVNEFKPTGEYSIEYNGSSAIGGLSSGTYFYKLSTEQFTQTKKMVLIK